MADASKDEPEPEAGEDKLESNQKSESSDNAQFHEVVRGFMVEKELLSKRHVEEIEKLKEDFSKERLKILETRQAEPSVSQSNSNSVQYGQASHSSVGFREQTGFAQSNGHTLTDGVRQFDDLKSAYQNGTMHTDVQQKGFYGNRVKNGYDRSTELFPPKVPSSSLVQGPPGALPCSSTEFHHTQQHCQLSSDAEQHGYSAESKSQRHLNGFAERSIDSIRTGMSKGRTSQHLLASHYQNGNLIINNLPDMSSGRDVYTGDAGHSQHLNTYFHQHNSMNSVHNTGSNRSSNVLSSGTQVVSRNEAAVGHLTKEIQDGSSVKGVSQTSPWVPEFYTCNPRSLKDSVGVKCSNDKETYGVSLELANGPTMRVNSGSLASQIRPDLDFEDKLEQMQEFLQERFAEEKRQLRRNLQEEFTRNLHVEKRKHEERLQTLKQTNLELEYQRKEIEVKIRHERENLEMKYENERSEFERKLRKDLEDLRSKSNLKYEAEMRQQKEKYEEIVQKQKRDIESLTIQLEELNESLRQEKDQIVAKFEGEVKDIEERLRIQKEKTESELVVKMKSDISLLTSVNQSLRQEVDRKEKEKHELETIMKEERNTIESIYESQISEIEEHYEAEKQMFLAQHEEKIAMLWKTEKCALEETWKSSNEEVSSLRKENDTLRKLAEKNYEMEQQANKERDEIVQDLIEEKELLISQLQKAISKQSLSTDIQDREKDITKLNTQKELEESRNFSAKLHNDLKVAEEERTRLALKVKELLKETEKLKRRDEEVDTAKEERQKLLGEVSKLNEEIDIMFEDVREKGRREIALKERLNEAEETIRQKESENTTLKMEKMENQSRLGVLERQNVDLKDDLSTLRRQKVELDEENCTLKREKSDCQGKVSVLQTTNEGLVEELQSMKQKFSRSKEEVAVLKLGKLELQQEIRMLKMHQSAYEEAMKGLNTSGSEGSGSILTSADETGEGTEIELTRRAKKRSTLGRQINRLKRTKGDYEMNVERLKQDIEALEREAMKQIEHNKGLSAEFVSTKDDLEKQIEELKCSKKFLENSIFETKREERNIQGKISHLEKQKKELESAVEYLLEEEKRLRETNEKEMDQASKTLLANEEHILLQISLLESNKRELQAEIKKMESDEAALRCSIEDQQKESEILQQRISQMKEELQDVSRKKVSWLEDREITDAKTSLGLDDLKEEISRLRRERDNLLRSVNELERKHTNLDINVTSTEKNRERCEKELSVLTQMKSELESTVHSLKTERFELETQVNELSVTTVEHATNAQRKEIEMLQSELEITRENCENIRSMYHGVHNASKSKVEVVEAELRMAEDSLVRLKRERLELEKTISTLLRQKTELEAEVAMVADAKFREDRDTTALREERLDLDAEVIRLKSQVSGLRSVMSTLEDAKCMTERELESLETRKERVDRYVSGMEARLLAGQTSPISVNFNQTKDYVLTSGDDLEKQVLELKEQKLSLEEELFKLRRKSGDGIDTRSRSYDDAWIPGEHRASFGHLGTTKDYAAQNAHHQNESLQREIEGLAHQKSKLSSEVTEMEVRRTDLDAEITNLEYRKLGLEQSGRLVQRQEDDGFQELAAFSESTKVSSREEYSNNFVDYSVEQIQDLRKKNTSLEDKMTVLERHLHDAKCEMEMQTLECQKELHLVQHTIKAHESDPTQQHQLNLIVDRLKAFIANSETSNTDKLYEEIKNEIKELNEKVDANSQQVMDIQKSLSRIRKEESRHKETTLKAEDVDEICEHIKDAEEGMKKYNHVVSRLQQENTDLMDIVSKLEQRLSAAGKSHEKLQRKKAILLQLLEKVGKNSGEDLIQQSNVIFELDKDTPV